MRAPSARIRASLAAAVVPLSVLGAGAMVWHGSYAAFSASTRNAGNDWSTGAVSLTDDDAGTARFTASDIVPGQSETRCIRVTSTSNVAGIVKLYVIDPVTTAAGLGDHLRLTVRSGDGGGFGSCSGFTSGATLLSDVTLTDVIADYDSYAHGAGSWTTTGNPSGESRTYQLTWTFDVTGLTQEQLDGLQGSHVGLDFQWELQNA